MKKRERSRRSAMYYVEPVQVYLSWLLLRLRLNATHVTVLWFLIALLAYGIMAIGEPWCFVAGALLLFLKILLDGSDGEVARYDKQFVSAEEDLSAFVNGVYLDKVFHSIEKPLWGLALAWGLYRATGEAYIFAAGVSFSVFLSFTRVNRELLKSLPRQFQQKVHGLHAQGAFAGLRNAAENPHPLALRVFDQVHLAIKNGKHFNLLVLVCGVIDCICAASGVEGAAVFSLLLAAGAVAPAVCAYAVVRTAASGELLRRAVELK